MQHFQQVKKLRVRVIASLALLLVITLLLAVKLGPVQLSYHDIFIALSQHNPLNEVKQWLIVQLRLPRVIGALLVGAALSVSGAIYQGLFRNPLSDPGLLGISSGASFCVVLFIVFGKTIIPSLSTNFLPYLYPLVAFIGSLITVCFIYQLAKIRQSLNVTTLILAGIALNALLSSLTGLFIYSADDAAIRQVMVWTMGSFMNTHWVVIIAALPFIIIPLLFLVKIANFLNVNMLGESHAYCLGLSVKHHRLLCIILVALMTGAATAIAGPISFVGLIVPHALRLLIKQNHRVLLPACALLGGSIVIFADTLARTIIAPAELPVGLILGVFGAPYFLYLLLKRRGSHAGVK